MIVTRAGVDFSRMQQYSDDQETFDLRECLKSPYDTNLAVGIKNKHVRVTWEVLEVSDFGGEENKGCSNAKQEAWGSDEGGAGDAIDDRDGDAYGPNEGMVVGMLLVLGFGQEVVLAASNLDDEVGGWSGTEGEVYRCDDAEGFQGSRSLPATMENSESNGQITATRQDLAWPMASLGRHNTASGVPILSVSWSVFARRTRLHTQPFPDSLDRRGHRTGYLPFRCSTSQRVLTDPPKGTAADTATNASIRSRMSFLHHDFPLRRSGVLRPDEMILVLGAPGSGSTTLFKVIPNKCDGVHIPTLMAGQTLNFALSAKAPGSGGRSLGVSKEEFSG
ncbi:hypothetical protein BDM02DRAFT_3263957 [Thelephora ganbajun]|uniref:Uncharacterized protein n=1 Tax=Thelephora ganbajun TaxID=370292 RepID=A0ACB6Z1Z5_THEGA|nr:hypothetical protein BDM02DRAFT_3263957 [Thelephora ganbajun]